MSGITKNFFYWAPIAVLSVLLMPTPAHAQHGSTGSSTPTNTTPAEVDITTSGSTILKVNGVAVPTNGANATPNLASANAPVAGQAGAQQTFLVTTAPNGQTTAQVLVPAPQQTPATGQTGPTTAQQQILVTTPQPQATPAAGQAGAQQTFLVTTAPNGQPTIQQVQQTGQQQTQQVQTQQVQQTGQQQTQQVQQTGQQQTQQVQQNGQQQGFVAQQPPGQQTQQQPPANPGALVQLQRWSDVQKLFLPSQESGGRERDVSIKLQQDPDSYKYGSAWIDGMIFNGFSPFDPNYPTSSGCGVDPKTKQPRPVVSNTASQLTITAIPHTESHDEKGTVTVEQGFAVAASQALIDCMNFARQNRWYCSEKRPCTAVSLLSGGVLPASGLQEGKDSLLGFCSFRNGTVAAPNAADDGSEELAFDGSDLACSNAKVLTPSAQLKKAADENYTADQNVKANKKLTQLDDARIACEKSLANGNLEAFFTANQKILAEEKFINSHKKGNPDIAKKADDFDGDALAAKNFKKALAALSDAADKWSATSKDDDDGSETLKHLRTLVHDVINTKLTDDRDKEANKKYAEDILQIYDKISAKYRAAAMKEKKDPKKMEALLKEATATYEDAKKEKIFDSDQKDRIDTQIALIGQLKNELVRAGNDLPQDFGNPATDMQTLQGWEAKGQAAGCPDAMQLAQQVPIAQIVQIAQNANLSSDCQQYEAGMVETIMALSQTCQDAMVGQGGFPSAVGSQCQQALQMLPRGFAQELYQAMTSRNPVIPGTNLGYFGGALASGGGYLSNGFLSGTGGGAIGNLGQQNQAWATYARGGGGFGGAGLYSNGLLGVPAANAGGSTNVFSLPNFNASESTTSGFGF